jgi:hypothetical protein
MRVNVQRLKALVARQREEVPAARLPALAQAVAEVLSRAKLVCRAEILEMAPGRLVLLVTVLRPAALSIRAARVIEAAVAQAIGESALHAVFWRSADQPNAEGPGLDPAANCAEVTWAEHRKEREAITVHEITYEEFLRYAQGSTGTAP